MTTPIVLKAADVIAAARKAYDEKRLSAQGPTPMCRYRDDSGRPCAIGAALSDEQAAFLERFANPTVRRLKKTGVFACDDAVRLQELQGAHDMWGTITGLARVKYENAFRALIGLDPLPVEG